LIPAAQRHDASSSALVFDTFRGGVWTANGDAGTVSYVDVDKGTVAQEIPVGKDVRSVALSPDFRFLAAVDRDGAQVVLLDAESRAVLRAIPLGTHPRAAVWDAADPRWLYVAVEDDGAVAVVDRTAGVLAKEIGVGRLPSGIAVSRQRSEAYVTHRIDGNVTVVDLKSGAATVDVPLAVQPPNPDATVPQGRPFAFESLAWMPDGNVAWLPHELLAGFHPFQFQRVLFPTVSVVDLSARAEVQTDPADPTGAIAGRKNLFDAINILDSEGNTQVLSQPCAAALNPNGLVGYVVACASEDLLVFDAVHGIAVDLVRNLPGDHPVGIALDDTGQRAWVLSDQSKTLQMVDLAGGDVTRHVALVGNPIALVAKDPVDPKLRAGLTLWFRANSSKGDLAVTGNNWMSCGGCHLDGLVSTNQVFFDALSPADPTKDATIGHVGLKDYFSTSPTPDDPSFSPHDMVSAMLDMGGLAPDRSGAKRDGAADPNAPPPTAAQMAQSLARIVARDLPFGPTWLLPEPAASMPNLQYDTAWCGNCHQAEYAAWKTSVHAHAGEDKMVQFCVGVEQKIRGQQYSRLCAGCHQPSHLRTGDSSLSMSSDGVTCLGCHDTSRNIQAGGNGDIGQHGNDWTQDHKAWGLASLERLRKPEFCGGCHEQFVPGTGIQALTTLSEYEASPFAGTTTRCVDCHMPKDQNGVADHSAPGGNVYVSTTFGNDALTAAQKMKLSTALVVTASKGTGVVNVLVKNRSIGHSFPTGVTDIREAWVEVQAVDAQGNALAHFGGPDATTGLVPLGAARLGVDIATADGTLLFDHQLSNTVKIPFAVRIPSHGTQAFTVPVPAQLPAGTDHLDAVLVFRNLRTQYYRDATGDPTGHSPDVEVARGTAQ
jgi:DNA-binding beta-propeller fold protein YncE